MTSLSITEADGAFTIEADGLGLDAVASVLSALTPLWPSSSLTPKQIAGLVPTPVVKPVKPKATKKDPKPRFANSPAESHVCDVDGCGRVFTHAHGLTVHQARMHKSGTVVKEPHVAAETEWRLRCEDCEFTTAPEDTVGMRRHTINTHDGRLPSNVERTPSVA